MDKKQLEVMLKLAISERMKALGSKGGHARARNHTPEQLSALAKGIWRERKKRKRAAGA